VTVDAREAGEGLAAPGAFPLADRDGRERLAQVVRRAVGPAPDLKVFVKADMDLPFKHVNDLLQLCREAGALEASVVTREDRGPGNG
jgi:biopolymer transport protein ExbD